ncbi:MAG: hypothetical protein KDJ26_04145 [Alphaproteobacteria bacterium]|nr:hypothetical protein [Alphaproteobacteria bacterium]MCB1551174.1 hypothetical protein [Alphaproteobacteria bacterium]MCB9984423.1 hypothetical protein [Micavibrio sp.]HRK97812.1 hypothetical protein [Alphaproteobacteria bacterium]
MSLNPKDKQELARILYRCAVWIAVSDDSGGISAKNAEERILKKRIQYLYRDARNGTDEREILGIVLANSSKWKEWQENLINLMDEIGKNSEIISPKLCDIIMVIAKDVAMAFEERSLLSSLLFKISICVRNIFSSSRSDLSADELSSISKTEIAALHELATALKISNFHV